MTVRWPPQEGEGDHALAAVKTLLRAAAVSVDDDVLDEVLGSSPYYPSMLAISDTLDELGIEHETIEVPREELDSMKVPHLAHLSSSAYAVILEVRPEHVVLLRGPGRPTRVSRTSYERIWTGVALIPSGGRTASRPLLTTSPRAEVPPKVAHAAALAAIFACVAAFVTSGGLHTVPLVPGLAILATDILGIHLTRSLLLEEFRRAPVTGGFCGIGAKTNCKAVLDSPAAKLGSVSMADIGLGYFAGSLLYVVTLALQPPAAAHVGLIALKVMSLAALPYTLFSISYQAFRVKMWCPYCLLVQATLWVQAGLLVFVPTAEWSIDSTLASGPVWFGALVAVVPFLLWLALKKLVRKGLQYDALARVHDHLATQPRVVDAIVMNLEATTLPVAPLELVEGSRDARIVVTSYANLGCKFCAENHVTIARAMRTAEGNLCHITRLVGYDVADATQWAFLQELAQLLSDGRMDDANHRLDAWYETPAARRRPPPGTLSLDEAATKLLTAHREWSDSMPVEQVPSTYIGNVLWPRLIPLKAVQFLARAVALGDDTRDPVAMREHEHEHGHTHAR